MKPSGIVITALLLASASAQEFPPPVNTQAAGEHPPTPQEMLHYFELPEGFHVTLFAGEPDVRQPISMEFDDRGRLWVAENYTYEARGKYDEQLRDRIVILTDTDGDGQHDERKVFWDGGWMLTSVVWGFGGCWILNDSTLSFLPDQNGDDIPDSEPVVLLDGWTKEAGHNFVNGLMWGPDGWLYGRHGILDTSWPGTPGTPRDQRQPINCGIWRFHPIRHTFEVVCHGTTNPWGMDYNNDHEFFMTNNVLNHLWHVMPGAHYERMYGQDFQPQLYELMRPTADHYHWDTKTKWTESRDGKASDLGGGHSHCGGMIYYGNTFPEKYRGQLFMCNTHGRCVNVNRLERNGASWVGRREPDFLTVSNPWFRGVELRYGPLGRVYLSDWSDNGECHDHDGVHRTSGRIYCISYGRPKAITTTGGRSHPPAVLMKSEVADLVHASMGHDDGPHVAVDDWIRRRAVRIIQEQYMPITLRTEPMARRTLQFRHDQLGFAHNDSIGIALQHFQQSDDDTRLFQRATLLGSLDCLTVQDAQRLLESSSERVRAWAVGHILRNERLRMQCDAELRDAIRVEESATVARTAVSALQWLSKRDKGSATLASDVLTILTSESPVRLRLETDHNLRMMTWYATLQHAGARFDESNPSVAFRLLGIRKSVEDAVAQDQVQDVDGSFLRSLALALPQKRNSSARKEFARRQLDAILDALEGYASVDRPVGWAQYSNAFRKYGDKSIDQKIDQISAVFGDGNATESLRRLVRDRNADHDARRRAIQSLAAVGDKESLPALLSVLNDRAVYVTVSRVLGQFDDPQVPQALLSRWSGLRDGSRPLAVDTLCSRRSYAIALAGGLNDGTVSASDLSATHIRRLMSYGEDEIREAIEKHWGTMNESSEEKAATIAQLKQSLTRERLAKAELSAGAAIFKKQCANCHRLFGEGGRIGPDLTGSNRGNMDYLLGNIVDPSEVVPRQFTVSTLVTGRGRQINGVVVQETQATVQVQTDRELLTIPVAEIEERVNTGKSLMPDGLVRNLTAEQIRDLIAFIQQGT